MTSFPSKKNKRSSNETDLYIARKLRKRRIELGLKQSDLAQRLGITHQQIYKYERGIDRIPASRLYECSKILKVPICFFYEEEEKDFSDPEKRLFFSSTSLKKREARLKILVLKAILTDIKTKEEYEIEII